MEDRALPNFLEVRHLSVCQALLLRECSYCSRHRRRYYTDTPAPLQIHEAKEANGTSGFGGADALATKAPLFARVRAGASNNIINQPSSVGGIGPAYYPQVHVGAVEAFHVGGEPGTTRESRTRAAFEYDPFLDSVKSQDLV